MCVRCVYVTQEGHLPKDNNMLTNAPHPASMVMADEWTYPYTREEAAFPAEWVRARLWIRTARLGFSPTGGRIEFSSGGVA